MEWCTETIQKAVIPLRLRNTTCGQPCTGNVLGVGVQILCEPVPDGGGLSQTQRLITRRSAKR
jgi:hypothetical protein